MLALTVVWITRPLSLGSLVRQNPKRNVISRESTSTIPPGKIAELRSKHPQQMKELHSLFETGALTKQTT